MVPDGWRLLGRIAQVRWVAVGLALIYAAIGPHRGVPALPLLLLAGMAATSNIAVAWQRRSPHLPPRTMVLVTLAADFIWITGSAAALAPLHDDFATVIGYVVLGSESGLLLGWRGAVGAVAVGVLALLGENIRWAGGHVLDLAGIAYQSGTVAVAGVFAAVGCTELRVQQGELDEKTAALAINARTDHLTGLGNAYAIEEALAHLRTTAHGVLLIDVDGMRWANVVYGHEAGDEILRAVGRVLANLREPGDVSGRLGEDKFAVLLPGAGSMRTTAIADAVLDAVHNVALSVGRLSVSVGCAWTSGGPDGGGQATLEHADDALYAAKLRGGDRVVVQGAVERGSRWRLHNAVLSVLESDRGVYSVYQRIVRLDGGATVGWEALSRPQEWPADHGVEALFATAHRMGRGRDLDWRCRRSALWDASRLQSPLFVNVNVSGLLDPVHGVDQMLLICEWAHRDPGEVVLELSERDAIPELDRLRQVLAEYRQAGFRFALDDLGEGRTTLELVVAARPEFLKLARPLVQAAHSDVAARAAVRALVGYAHDIGSAVIAEGIEDVAERDLCMELGVDLGQGWLYGRPQTADRIPA